MTASIRRLINAQQLAEKLGFTRAWVYHNRARLESMGFPDPVLGTHAGGAARWDERAVDAWLDDRMPTHLRNTDARNALDAARSETDARERLAQRAREMAL